MDNQQSSSLPQTSGKLSPQIEEELAKVNKEIYERNVELAIRNRTLSVIRKMYEIMSTSLSVADTAQRLIDTIITELKFQKGFIALINNKVLKTEAVSTLQPKEEQLIALLGQPFRNFSLTLDQQDNFCVKAVLSQQVRMTNNLYDILTPQVKEKVTQQIQESLKIKTSIIYPIIFGKEVLGVLSIGMDKHIGSLSRAEVETLKEIIDVVAVAIERARIYIDLQEANKKLKELDVQKNEFLSVAAHEIRAPMTAVKGYLSMVMEVGVNSFTPQVTEFLNETIEANDRLIRLVNNMLNVSRIEENRLVYQMGIVNLTAVVKTVVDEFRFEAEKKGLEFKTDISNIPNDKVYVDQDRINEVVANLVSNAIKYTDKGSVTVKLYSPNDSHIRFEVADTGLGISNEEKDKLFQKFYRTQSSIGKQMGTGLGLYIAKLLVEKFGGKLEFASEFGKGSKFWFDLIVKDV